MTDWSTFRHCYCHLCFGVSSSWPWNQVEPWEGTGVTTCDNMRELTGIMKAVFPFPFLDMACTWRECRLQQMSMEPIQPSQDALKLKRAEGEKASSLIRAAFCRDITGCKHRHAETCHQWFCATNWHSRQQQLRKEVEATRQEQLRQDLQKQCRDRLQALAVKPKLLLSSWNSTYFMRLKIQQLQNTASCKSRLHMAFLRQFLAMTLEGGEPASFIDLKAYEVRRLWADIVTGSAAYVIVLVTWP